MIPPNNPRRVDYAAGPYSDANYLKTAAGGGVSAMNLGAGSTLVVVLDPTTAAVQSQATGVTPISCCTALSSDGWALFFTTNAAQANAPQVGMFYSHPTAPGYSWIQTLGSVQRVPGKPVRVVFVDDGTNWRVSVNGSPIVSVARGSYVNVLATARLSLGTFNGLAGFPDVDNKTASFAILHRAVSDAEAISESGRLNAWDIALASDAQCTIDANCTRDYSGGGATWTTLGSSPVVLTKAGTVSAVNTATNAYRHTPLTRPDDSHIWTPDSACGVSYNRCTQQARWILDTDAETLVVQQIVTELLPYYTDVSARIVGGATPTPVLLLGGFTQPYPHSGVLTLGTGGTPKVVELVASTQSNIGSYSVMLGGFPYVVNVPPGRYCTVRAPTIPTRRLVVYGDSLTTQRPSNPSINGPFGLLRLDYPGQATIVAALNRSLYDDITLGVGQAALVAQLVAACDGTITNELWISIGLEDHWRSLWPSGAAFTVAYASFLTALRAALPGVPFFVQTRGTAEGTYATNAYGETIAQWRVAQANACAGISGITVVDGAAMYTLADLAVDASTTPYKVHLSTAGAVVYKDAIKLAMGY